VGSAAIQIARQLGATSLPPVERCEREVQKNSEPSHHRFHAKDWPGRSRTITEKRGVNLVIEHVAAKYCGNVLPAWRAGARLSPAAPRRRDASR